MMLAPIWRTRFFTLGGALLAVWMGFAVAQQAFFLPALCLGGIGALLLSRLQPLPIGTVLLGGALLGYIVGNRGFAQLHIGNTLPLLPAEWVLLVGGTILMVQSAFRGELPLRREPLNLILLAWIVIGSVRLYFDFRAHGFGALRDYATVYYAVFFFLAQACARDTAGRNFLFRCLIVGCTLLLLIYPFYARFPAFFLGFLTVQGIPLIYYKGDLAGTFLAMGALVYFVRFEERGGRWRLAVSLVFVGAALASNNRAAMLGLAAITLLLGFSGRWRFAVMQGVSGILAALLILLTAHLADIPFHKTPLHGVYERVVSLGDPLGQRAYSGIETAYKGDNNLFRAVWWRAVFDETMEGGPWFGLGFGYDLADRFVRQYYPDSADEFSTRSPHNVLLTIFARMGLSGLLPFLAVAGLIVARTFRAMRTGEPRESVWWGGVCLLLVSACFGVVLEGPMGAVVFWTLLGVANTTASHSIESVAGQKQAEVATSDAER